MPSEIIAELPVIAAAVNLVAAMARLAMMAAYTALCDSATQRSNQFFDLVTQNRECDLAAVRRTANQRLGKFFRLIQSNFCRHGRLVGVDDRFHDDRARRAQRLLHDRAAFKAPF